ncbi:phosphatidic acid phosphatase [Corallococcus sp. H22C18031201]|nr:phosphatase PAP2 family protein [Citreicoccus inhibens]RJS27016.1 phosphatidic acid phosphatase [Corallococcus sp. H22C18031201]
MLATVRPAPRSLALVALLLLLPGAPVRAESGEAPTPPYALRFDWTRDGLLTGIPAVLWITSETLFKDDLAPAHCRWCDRASDGRDTLNRLDRWGRGLAGDTPDARRRADTWSNAVGFAGVPLAMFGLKYAVGASGPDSGARFAQDATIMLESAMLGSVFNQAVKFAAGRERPFVHVLPDADKRLTAHPNDNNLSFYSGHTQLAFSLVVSAGTVAALRGDAHQAWLWGIGLPLATSVGLLRMAADKHYLTDVVTGAVLGSAFGAAVPLLLHGRTDDTTPSTPPRLSLSVGPRDVGLSGSF